MQTQYKLSWSRQRNRPNDVQLVSEAAHRSAACSRKKKYFSLCDLNFDLLLCPSNLTYTASR